MTRDEATKLTVESKRYRRRAGYAWDAAKNCDTFDFTTKDANYAEANKYWSLSDEINQRIRNAGFADLLDDDEDGEL